MKLYAVALLVLASLFISGCPSKLKKLECNPDSPSSSQEACSTFHEEDLLVIQTRELLWKEIKHHRSANKHGIGAYTPVNAIFYTEDNWMYFLLEDFNQSLCQSKIFIDRNANRTNIVLTHEESSKTYGMKLHEVAAYIKNKARRSQKCATVNEEDSPLCCK